ncbi:MAG: hypothetical protein ABI947_06510 [Chloroflexota bacterium]
MREIIAKRDQIYFDGLNAELKIALGERYQGIKAAVDDHGKVITLNNDGTLTAGVLYVFLSDEASKDDEAAALAVIAAHNPQPYFDALAAKAAEAAAQQAKLETAGITGDTIALVAKLLDVVESLQARVTQLEGQ